MRFRENGKEVERHRRRELLMRKEEKEKSKEEMERRDSRPKILGMGKGRKKEGMEREKEGKEN